MEPANQQPTSLQRTQLKIADLAEMRKGQPLGLIPYASSAHLVLLPTQDTSVIAQMAAEISSDIMPAPGDRFDLAIKETQRIMTSEKTSGSILVIADSVNADATQLAAAQKALAGTSLQFLAISDNDPSKLQSIRNVASTLNASVTELSVDDTDIAAIVRKSERVSYASVAGKETHWQEAPVGNLRDIWAGCSGHALQRKFFHLKSPSKLSLKDWFHSWGQVNIKQI